MEDGANFRGFSGNMQADNAGLGHNSKLVPL